MTREVEIVSDTVRGAGISGISFPYGQKWTTRKNWVELSACYSISLITQSQDRVKPGGGQINGTGMVPWVALRKPENRTQFCKRVLL